MGNFHRYVLDDGAHAILKGHLHIITGQKQKVKKDLQKKNP